MQKMSLDPLAREQLAAARTAFSGRAPAPGPSKARAEAAMPRSNQHAAALRSAARRGRRVDRHPAHASRPRHPRQCRTSTLVFFWFAITEASSHAPGNELLHATMLVMMGFAQDQ
jgi:hypothetical protein